ncbi:hypothetical protein PTKIN_Ptkin05aG0178300 [Pterospermum kingtungense]
MESDEEDDDLGEQYNYIPIGYRFVPTDEELMSYLIDKVFGNPIPDSLFQEMRATEFYARPPQSSVEIPEEETECFLFIHEDGSYYYDYKQNKRIRIVGEGLGFWQSCEEEKPLFDINGHLLAFKIHLIYFEFEGCLLKPKKTHWEMDEYRLPIQFYTSLHRSKEKWAVGRLTSGTDYDDFGF